MLLKIIALFSAFVNGFSDFVGSVFLGIFLIHLSQTIDWKIRLWYIIKTKGQLTQLVEYLRHMEGVRGSSPLLPTIIRTSPRGLSGFFFFKKNPNFAFWLVRLGSAIWEDELRDARAHARCSVAVAPCESLIAHHVETQRILQIRQRKLSYLL